jgi:hypothetical protein
MKVAALIIGIDGWEKYTLPLIESIKCWEPTCNLTVIDNASVDPYPTSSFIHRTQRLCYSAAINVAHDMGGEADWYIVLSNDVLCTGPFAHMLAEMPDIWIVGPRLVRNQGWTYLEGWCVCVPATVWDDIGGWDERFQVSSWEDVDFSQMALEKGYNLAHCPELPFKHLDQKQRFTIIPDYWSSERHNLDLFVNKRRLVAK